MSGFTYEQLQICPSCGGWNSCVCCSSNGEWEFTSSNTDPKALNLDKVPMRGSCQCQVPYLGAQSWPSGGIPPKPRCERCGKEVVVMVPAAEVVKRLKEIPPYISIYSVRHKIEKLIRDLEQGVVK